MKRIAKYFALAPFIVLGFVFFTGWAMLGCVLGGAE